jgi:2-phosphoglycolate phosphatase
MPDRPIKGFLLDLDGTLADTAPDLAAALNALLTEEGREPLDYQRIRPFVSYGSPRLIRMGFGEDLAGSEFERLKNRFLAFYRLQICQHTRLFPGIGDVLETIETVGLTWGVVTNKPGWLTIPLMTELGLMQRAGSIISGDTLERRKPHPDPLVRAASDLHIDTAECAYIGDAQRDIEAGRAAGMFTIAVSWGYIPADENIYDWDANRVLDAPHEILEYVQQQGLGTE